MDGNLHMSDHITYQSEEEHNAQGESLMNNPKPNNEPVSEISTDELIKHYGISQRGAYDLIVASRLESQQKKIDELELDRDNWVKEYQREVDVHFRMDKKIEELEKDNLQTLQQVIDGEKYSDDLNRLIEKVKDDLLYLDCYCDNPSKYCVKHESLQAIEDFEKEKK